MTNAIPDPNFKPATKYILDPGAEYLTFVPRHSSDAEFRLVMETEGDVVTQIRSGLLPYVEFVEGCA